MRRTAPFTWNLARGFSWFSGASSDSAHIVATFNEAASQYTNLWPTARVCAERCRWPENHDYLYQSSACEPYNQNAPAFRETKHFLDWAASVPHAQVLLVPVCTLKEKWSQADLDSGVAFDVNEAWVRNVCRLASDYENVAVEVINEWRHPGSIYTEYGKRNRQDQVIRMIQACRQEAPRTLIGTDTNVNANRTEYDPAIEPYVDFLSFHPWRNPDPDEAQLRAMVRQRIGAAVFSETTCYDVGAAAKGNCTGDWQQILDYQENAEHKGGVFFYHSKYRGLCDPREDCLTKDEPFPPRGDHAIRHGK